VPKANYFIKSPQHQRDPKHENIPFFISKKYGFVEALMETAVLFFGGMFVFL